MTAKHLIEYAPPGTACFPYGDEEMNTNVLQKPELNEVRQQREEGKKSDCPQRCSSSSDLKVSSRARACLPILKIKPLHVKQIEIIFCQKLSLIKIN